jgi:hypothetical protein
VLCEVNTTIGKFTLTNKKLNKSTYKILWRARGLSKTLLQQTWEALKPANKFAKRPKEAKILFWKRAKFG